jgi:hypothetical protein
MENCSEAYVEIKKEIRNFLYIKKFRATEQYLNVEDEAEVQRHRFIT